MFSPIRPHTISTPVRVVGNLGSDANTVVFATSDGDTIVETTDWWFGTDDADGTGTPAVIHLLHGPEGLVPSNVTVTDDNVEWTYNLTVDAGQTKRLAYFTVLGTTRADDRRRYSLVTNTGFGGQAAAFLTAGELSSLANFQFGTLSATVDGSGNLTISDTDGTKNNNLTLKKVNIGGQDYLQISDPTELFANTGTGTYQVLL